MGHPIHFDGANTLMRAPEGTENVQDLYVFCNSFAAVSCWELSPEEIEEIRRTGRIYLSVLMGGAQPPVFVGSEETVRSVVVDFGPVWPKAGR
jgi:hypothetical protein